MTRRSPYFSWSPAVAPKTPPFLPMSSPRTTTRSSFAIATWSASLIAASSVISGIVSSFRKPARACASSSQRELPAGVLDRSARLDLVEDALALLDEVRRQRREDVVEQRLDRRRRRLLGLVDRLADVGGHLLGDRLLPRLRPDLLLLEERAEARDRV